ncbi:MAG: hypothetical protein ABJE95_00900 [Byssovorax sp.]
MRDVDDAGDKQGSHEPPDARKQVSAPQDGYEPHPLFPCEHDGPERRDIRFVSFRRRRSDGKIDNCAEDIPAAEIRSWKQVVGPWGGGEYKALGKDKNHRIVAWYPEKSGEWVLFDGASKPFTLRDPRYQQSPTSAVPAITAAPSMSPASIPADTVLLELLRELRATPSASTFSHDEPVVAMIQAHIEFLRTVLRVMLTRPAGTSLLSVVNPMILGLQLLSALQGGVPDP